MQILQVPFNAGNLKRRDGVEQAPQAIIKALDDFYLTEAGESYEYHCQELNVDSSQIDASHEVIRDAVQPLQEYRILGGDHSITKSAVTGFSKRCERPGLVVFDAHPDVMEPFDTHEDYLRSVIEHDTISADDVIIVGVRNWHEQEHDYIQEQKVQYVSMREVSREGKSDVCDTIMMNMRPCSDVYVSIDIDVLDPAFAPGTGYHEPGGFTTRELLYFVQRLKQLENVNVFDIVEVNPVIDADTAKVAAKVVVETL